jgi:dye decolorizing peroxidase
MTGSGPSPAPESSPAGSTFSRRALFAGVGAAGVAGLAGFALGSAVDGPSQDAALTATGPVPALGEHQPGIERPRIPQQHCLLAVLDVDIDELRESLAGLGERIVELTDPAAAAPPVPDGPGDLSVTVGLGARALAATAAPELADLVALPPFAGDAGLPAEVLGGDLLLSVNASDPGILEPVLAALVAVVAGARLRWSEFGFRGAPVEGVVRNSLGYWDGIVRPSSAAEFDSDVWIGSGRLAGGTICVVRRFRLEVERFRGLPSAERDATIGRVEGSGAPLSGGVRDTPVDLSAKTPSGEFLVPANAHVRAAHPSFTGSPLMLRRGYSYRSTATDLGHLFVSFQNDVATFTRTQLRLDEVDALMRFATPTATGAFAILPGWQDGSTLGGTLF